jgi:predicted acetyltransferase
VTAEELPAFLRAVREAFHEELPDADLALLRRVVEPDRALAVRDAGRIVATAGIYSRRLTVPGGELPVAAVTLVGVAATHRRRGLLTALMRRQLDDVRAAGREAVAALWASESAIYGRFGYGMGSLAAELRIVRSDVRWRSPPPRGGVVVSPAADAQDALAVLHDAARRERPGMLDRAGAWWDMIMADPPDERDGAQALRAAVAGEEGYALYAVKPRLADRPRGEVRIDELIPVTPEGHAALWGFLLELDLTHEIVWELAPSDEPLVHRLEEARAVQTRVGDGLWVRLVDLPRALTGRTYGAPFETVFEVTDAFCPWNAGRWALRWDGGTAVCERTSRPAGLALGAAELGAAYLGGTALRSLAFAGRVEERQGGALAAASRAFLGERAPFCPEIF